MHLVYHFKLSVSQSVFLQKDIHNDSVLTGMYVFLNIFPEAQVEAYTASRREEACLLNACNVVARQVTSELVTVDLKLTCFSGVLGPSRYRNTNYPLCTVHTCTRFASFPILAW